MPRLDYAAAIKAGKTPQEIKAFVDAQNASGNRLEVVNIAPGIAPRKPGALDRAAGASNKFMGALAGFTGLDKAGESLGRLGLQLSDVGNKAAGVKQTTFNVPKATGKQIAGDVLTLGGAGLSLAAPGATLARRAAANAAASGMLGAGKELTSGNGVGTAVGSGLVKGVVAGGVTAGVGLLGKLANGLTKGGAQNIYKTSARLENQADAGRLMDLGMTGSRKALGGVSGKEGRVAAALAGTETALQSNPEFRSATVDPAKVYDSPALKALYEKTAAQGLPKAYREPTDRLVLSKVGGMSAPDALNLARALYEDTPEAAFRGRSSNLKTKVEKAIADAYRSLVSKAAPSADPALYDEQQLIYLKQALERHANATNSGVPFNTGNALQRTILTPAVGTKVASGLHRAGKSLDKLDANMLVKALKRAGRIGSVTGLGGL